MPAVTAIRWISGQEGISHAGGANQPEAAEADVDELDAVAALADADLGVMAVGVGHGGVSERPLERAARDYACAPVVAAFDAGEGCDR